jgi:hypothetical protein
MLRKTRERVREFTFELKLNGTVNVRARSRKAALAAAQRYFDAVDIPATTDRAIIGGKGRQSITISGASLSVDDVSPLLVAIDGQEINDD